MRSPTMPSAVMWRLRREALTAFAVRRTGARARWVGCRFGTREVRSAVWSARRTGCGPGENCRRVRVPLQRRAMFVIDPLAVRRSLLWKASTAPSGFGAEDAVDLVVAERTDHHEDRCRCVCRRGSSCCGSWSAVHWSVPSESIVFHVCGLTMPSSRLDALLQRLDAGLRRRAEDPVDAAGVVAAQRQGASGWRPDGVAGRFVLVALGGRESASLSMSSQATSRMMLVTVIFFPAGKTCTAARSPAESARRSGLVVPWLLLSGRCNGRNRWSAGRGFRTVLPCRSVRSHRGEAVATK